MAKQTINTIRNWFRTGLKPTQNQFWDMLDSFWHKDDEIAIDKVQGLAEILNQKADAELIAVIISLLTPAVPIEVNGVENYTLVWDDEKKAKHGDFAKGFNIWQANSLQQVPISYTTGEDGKPNAYNFTLDNIDTLIFIL